MLGLTVAPYMITTFTLGERVTPASRTGAAMTALAAAMGLGYAIGAALAGRLADWGGDTPAHGDEGASHAVTYYAVVETSAQKLAWLSLKPVTGRTHQLRAHTAHIGHAIVGHPKYFNKENCHLPGGRQNRPHPSRGTGRS